MLDTTGWPGLNALAAPLVNRFASEADSLRLAVSRGPSGERLIDAGAVSAGGIEAGRRIAEICMAGLGSVTLSRSGSVDWPLGVLVQSSHPVAACLASQYAGWSLSDKTGGKTYSVLGSGPGRAMAAREDLFGEIGYRDKPGPAVFVLETGKAPPQALVAKVADACGVEPSDLTFVYAPTESLAGSTQVVARVLEVAMHKAHALGFALDNIVDGAAAAPLCPPSPDFVTAMGRTNDAIIFAGQAHLFVRGTDKAARELAEQMPSSASRDSGQPLAKIFAASGHDFYAIDPHLFSPAAVAVTVLDSGRTCRAGAIDLAALERSFAG